MTEVSSQVINSSAIPTWSGFVYQGKVALYHAIRLLVQRNSEAHYLRVEHLDDFAIYDSKENVLSLHQVKAMKSDKRSSYNPALKQASKFSEKCNQNTVRWFHVAIALDDFSDKTENHADGEHLVQFYKYHDERYYVETNAIDIKLSEIVTQYLKVHELPSTEEQISYKLAKLEALLASKVNLAHYRNQHESLNKFEAAESIPISFLEIVGCLMSEVIPSNDPQAILFEFRKTLLNRTSQILDTLESNQDIDLNGIFICRYAVANMDIPLLTRLYYSKKPSQNAITLAGFSNDTVDQYLRIIWKIIGVKTTEDLPHYFKDGYGSYIPTAMTLDSINQELDVNQIQENVNGIRGNLTVQDLLYDFDNLIVHMDSNSFQLCNESSAIGKFTDISEPDKSRITKINNVRFVSMADATSEIND
ncbi:ABC-three component system protein [Flocculibacter collagenilyticus]|uniref:ABC-three component system protein n=1 Tax=Flocculibacter collagenilyticus TaxID=2744479 RepID=UPI0018F6AC21|nr:ABC-three component system protein [Flocculibacter collagenilyticus]